MELSGLINAFMKLAPLPAFVLAVCSGISLFASDSFLTKFGIRELRNAHRPWFGVTFLITTIYFLSHLVHLAFVKVSSFIESYRFKKEVHRRLHELTPDEKDCLRMYIDDQNRSHPFDYGNPVVRGLEAAHILYAPCQVSAAYTARNYTIAAIMAYNISDWAWDYLSDHPECLQ